MTEESPGARDSSQTIILAVLFEGSLAPLAVFLGWVLGQPALEGFAWRAEDAAIGAVATLPMLALFWLVERWPLGPLRTIRRFFEEEARPILAACTWPDLALIAVAAGVGEEMLFRGVFQGLLGRWLGRWAGLGAASLLFGLLHPISPAYIVLAMLMGAYLGWLWIWSGNLLTVIVAHALYDFFALLLLLREEPEPA
jgi:membrane protease YdiL (CAAX protease family)